VHCFSYDIHDLDFNGYFALSASSGNPGVAYPVYNTVNSFKIYDPKVVSTSHHFEDSHREKAAHEHYAETIAARTDDLIHTGAAGTSPDGF